MQQATVMKDRDGNVLASKESVKEYFKGLRNEENESERRVGWFWGSEPGSVVD